MDRLTQEDVVLRICDLKLTVKSFRLKDPLFNKGINICQIKSNVLDIKTAVHSIVQICKQHTEKMVSLAKMLCIITRSCKAQNKCQCKCLKS